LFLFICMFRLKRVQNIQLNKFNDYSMKWTHLKVCVAVCSFEINSLFFVFLQKNYKRNVNVVNHYKTKWNDVFRIYKHFKYSYKTKDSSFFFFFFFRSFVRWSVHLFFIRLFHSTQVLNLFKSHFFFFSCQYILYHLCACVCARFLVHFLFLK